MSSASTSRCSYTCSCFMFLHHDTRSRDVDVSTAEESGPISLSPMWEVKTLAAREAMNYDSVLAQRTKNSVANQRLLSAAGLVNNPNLNTAVLREDTQRKMLKGTKVFINDGVRITKHGLEYTAYVAKQGRPKSPNNPFEYSDPYIRTIQYTKPPSLYTRKGTVHATSTADSMSAMAERQPRPYSAMSRANFESRSDSRGYRPTSALSRYTFEPSEALCDTLQPFRPLSALSMLRSNVPAPLAESRSRTSMVDNPYAPRRGYAAQIRKSGTKKLRPASASSQTREALALLAYQSRTVTGPSGALKSPAMRTSDLLQVDCQHIETMCNDPTLMTAAKLLRQHICAGVLHLGMQCKIVLEYQVPPPGSFLNASADVLSGGQTTEGVHEMLKALKRLNILDGSLERLSGMCVCVCVCVCVCLFLCGCVSAACLVARLWVWVGSKCGYSILILSLLCRNCEPRCVWMCVNVCVHVCVHARVYVRVCVYV